MSFAVDDITVVFEGVETDGITGPSGGQMPIEGGSKIMIDIAGRGVGITGETGPAGINMISINGYPFELAGNCTRLWPLLPDRGAPMDFGHLRRPLMIRIAKDGSCRFEGHSSEIEEN